MILPALECNNSAAPVQGAEQAGMQQIGLAARRRWKIALRLQCRKLSQAVASCRKLSQAVALNSKLKKFTAVHEDNKYSNIHRDLLSA